MSDVQWHSHGVSFTTDASAINYLEIHTYNISLISPRHQWVKRGNIQVEGIPPKKQYQLNRNVLRLENLLNLRQLSLRIWDVLENHSQAINMFWVPRLLSWHSFSPMIQIFSLLNYLNSHYTLIEVMVILTHWGRVMHICVDKLTIIGSDNGLSPSRRQAIIWANAGILLMEPLGTNFSENLIEIHTFSFKKMHLKMLKMAVICVTDVLSYSCEIVLRQMPQELTKEMPTLV